MHRSLKRHKHVHQGKFMLLHSPQFDRLACFILCHLMSSWIYFSFKIKNAEYCECCCVPHSDKEQRLPNIESVWIGTVENCLPHRIFREEFSVRSYLFFSLCCWLMNAWRKQSQTKNLIKSLPVAVERRFVFVLVLVSSFSFFSFFFTRISTNANRWRIPFRQHDNFFSLSPKCENKLHIMCVRSHKMLGSCRNSLLQV